MENLFNYDIFLLFLGGLFSVILAVSIIFAKQEYKRNIERDRLKVVQQQNPEEVGDIEAKLNDSFEFKRLNFLELLTNWGLQPLFIICFLNLFTVQGTIEIIVTFSMMIFIILHELWTGSQYSKDRWYQILNLILWVVFFVMFSYRDNILKHKDETKHNTEQTQTTKQE